MRTTVAALITTLLAACGTGAPTEEVTRTVTLGSFEAEIDTATGTFRVWTPTSAPSGSASIASIGELPEGSGAGGYVTVANVGSAVANDPNGCASNTPGAVATVRITSHYPTGSYLRNVYAQINSTNPVTGSSGCNSAQSFPSGSGLSNSLGLWGYGPINPTQTADAIWRLSRTSTTSYRFSGKIYGEVVTQVVPTTTTVAITNPTAIAWDTQNLWVAGAGSTSNLYSFTPALVQKSGSPFAMSSNTATLLPTAATASQSNNNIWVTSADTVNHTSMVQNFAVNNGGGTTPFTVAGAELVAIANDTGRNNVFAADQYGGKVYVYDAPNSKLQTTLTQSAPNNIGTTPVALAYDGAAMWVANAGSNDLTVIVTTGSGNNQTFTGTKVAAGSRPVAIAYDNSANMWVANQGSFTITRHPTSGLTANLTVAVTNQPDDIAVDVTGNVWVLSKNARVLTKVSSAGSVLGIYALTFQPTKIRYFGGYLWIGDSSGSVLVRWTG